MQSPAPNIRDVILTVLTAHPDIRLAILFGSLATGNENTQSDLDLAVDAGRQLMDNEKISLIAELAERLGRPVDLVDIQAIGEPLLGQILKHGQKILGSDSDYARILCRHLFDQADYLPYRNRILAERRQAWIGK